MANKDERQKMPRFENYRGIKTWHVEHPDHRGA